MQQLKGTASLPVSSFAGVFLQFSVLLANYVTNDWVSLSKAFLQPSLKMFSKKNQSCFTPTPGINSAHSVKSQESLTFSLSQGTITTKSHGKE